MRLASITDRAHKRVRRGKDTRKEMLLSSLLALKGKKYVR